MINRMSQNCFKCQILLQFRNQNIQSHISKCATKLNPFLAPRQVWLWKEGYSGWKQCEVRSIAFLYSSVKARGTQKFSFDWHCYRTTSHSLGLQVLETEISLTGRQCGLCLDSTAHIPGTSPLPHTWPRKISLFLLISLTTYFDTQCIHLLGCHNKGP